MKISFEIKQFPKETHSYHIPAYTEGTLSIEINSDVVFNRDEILLVEFANTIELWLKQGPANFLYNSINYEEGPIIAFIQQPDGTFVFDSVWKRSKSDKPISLNELSAAFSEYLELIKNEVNLRKG